MASFEEGLAVRREVPGTEPVDDSLAHASDCSRPMQKLVIEHCSVAEGLLEELGGTVAPELARA